jgi:ribonuclease T1
VLVASCGTSPAATTDPTAVAWDCESVVEGGRYPDIPDVSRNDLDVCRPEAGETLSLIIANGPFPYPQDNEPFFNREGYLAPAGTGAYREYTVDTPGLNHRGMRRLVTRGSPDRVPGTFQAAFYTDDHYNSFWRIIDP